ncbi:4-(cytidine 5'-diphospho)-2-C-methyl-D-erythritol kinase [Tannockella kyphosi]|uniref:4-(cytidine 5'-diphospho)-2-C-methyl-D-erythritol kinase n=1 Tax=Tannockella kyphosi TaxID=2899121 RepID=UPI00201295E7|nr:4-(cytidine 5'-diphospho)-2-C-methyl-D-erythritol kinase [Tannockella kyphosi]
MKIRAYAKVNLALDVVRKREDGYHDLEMIMAPIELHDLLYVDKIQEGIIVESSNPTIPTDQRNIAYQVASLMIERYQINGGVKIFIYKHIPSQAGLAGGSADGAAVIKAINYLYHLGLSYRDMAELGKEVGADIPFCIYERLALVKGIGEKLNFIQNNFEAYLLLVKPKKGVSTKKAFETLNIEKAIHHDCMTMKKALEEDNYPVVVSQLQNTLELPSIGMVPEIEEIKKEIIELGFDGALMSGSGSCVFGITRDEQILETGLKHFKNKYYFVRKTKLLQKEK